MKDKSKKDLEANMSNEQKAESYYFDKIKQLNEKAYAAHEKLLAVNNKYPDSEGLVIEGDYIIMNDYFKEHINAMLEFIMICNERELYVNLMKNRIKRRKAKGSTKSEGGGD